MKIQKSYLVVILFVIACMWPLASVQAVTLGISADGRFFTLDGVPTYLNGVSYYGAQSISTASYRTQDLDDMVADGFNWMRVWVYWEYPDPGEDVSVMTHNGAVREPYMSRLKTLITECNNRGIIVDCSFPRDGNGDWVGPRNQSEHLAAVQTLANELLSYSNVYIDVANERDVGDDRYVSLTNCGQLIDAIKAINPNRLCTASGVPGSQSELNNYFTQGHVDFITPHLCRNTGCSAQTVGMVNQFVGWMNNLGFRAPVHLQEPFRRGYASYNPTVEDFYRDCSGGKIAEAAGWCLHNGNNKLDSPDYRPWRCFNMSNAEGRLYAQWDSVESTVTNVIDEQIGGTDSRVRRYQAEYSEQLPHLIGQRDGYTWSANVASHSTGYLSYGPYIETVPTGQHLATWRLKIDTISGSNDVVVTIDVSRDYGATTLASLDIHRQEFTASDTWQEFSLLFTSNTGNNLEFRTYWYDKAKINLDWITLSIGTNPLLAFTDITSSSGTGGPGYYGGHGVMWADVTDDARPDFYVTMNFQPTNMAELFYRNLNGSSFAEEAATRGIDDYDTGSHGGVWGDVDNDGDYDLVNGGFDRNRVFENTGAGYFTDRTSGSGFENVNNGTRGTLMFDFDKDGDLDVFCNSWGPLGEDNEFYRNNGGWSFTRIDNGLRNIGGVQGTTEADFDNDNDLDLLVCKGYGDDGAIMAMRNSGGNFTNVTSSIGLNGTTNNQQGATFCDINNDGWLDLHVQQDSNNSQLYTNDGDGTFTSKSVTNGPGFMAGFEDLDNDGDWDMVYPGDNKVYLNDGNGNFTPSANFSTGTINDPRAVAFADMDNDGDMDFFYAQKRTYNILIRNDLSNGGNWLKVRLISPDGQAGAFGAKVKTYDAGHAGEAGYMISFREARSQEGYLGQNEPVLHFGVGLRISVDIEVSFLDGTVMTQNNVTVNQTILVDASPLTAPVIAEVTPDPDSVTAGVEYIKLLTLIQGSLPVTWSVVSGPTTGTQVSGIGLVSGWTPTISDIGSSFTLIVQASNSQGDDTEQWDVAVQSIADFDYDNDVDLEDFGQFQVCYSGPGREYPSGCENADLDDDNDVDQTDFTQFQSCMAGANIVPPGC